MNEKQIYDEEIDKKIHKIMNSYDESRRTIIMMDDAELKKFLVEKNYEIAIRDLRLIINSMD